MSDPLTPRRRSKRGRSEEDPSSPSNANGVDEPVTRKSNKLIMISTTVQESTVLPCHQPADEHKCS